MKKFILIGLMILAYPSFADDDFDNIDDSGNNVIFVNLSSSCLDCYIDGVFLGSCASDGYLSTTVSFAYHSLVAVAPDGKSRIRPIILQDETDYYGWIIEDMTHKAGAQGLFFAKTALFY